MPPQPITGMSTALTQASAQRRAIGLIATPEYPPTIVLRRGLRVRQSTPTPSTVLTAVIASAPPRSTATAMSSIRVTFGESFAKMGLRVASRTRRITSSATAGSVLNGSLPPSTFGQERFTSSASTSGRVSSSAASSANSAALCPPMFVTIRVSASATSGSVRSM